MFIGLVILICLWVAVDDCFVIGGFISVNLLFGIGCYCCLIVTRFWILLVWFGLLLL